MFNYFHLLFLKIFIYAFTIIFHGWLLSRSLLNTRYVLALLLMIPIIAVSIKLWKLLSASIINVRTNDLGLEFKTILGTHSYRNDEISIKKREIRTSDGKRFLVQPSKSDDLIKQLEING